MMRNEYLDQLNKSRDNKTALKDKRDTDPLKILSPEVLNLNGADLKDSYNVFVDLRFAGGFNWLFDTKEDHGILIAMLNSFLPTSIPPIKSLTNTLQPLMEGEDPMNYVFNLCYYDDLGRLILIDVQKTAFKNYQHWTAARLAKAATIGTRNMESPSKEIIGVNQPVIGLTIIDFVDMDEPYKNCINLVGNSEGQPFEVDLTAPLLLFANLHNMKDSKIAEAVGALSNDKDKYLFILKYMGRMSEVPDELDTDQFGPLFERASMAGMGEEELKDYFLKATDQMTYEEALATHRKEFFINEFKEYFMQELEMVENKRKHQEETTIHLCSTTSLEWQDIAEVVGLSLMEVKNLLDNYGGNYSY